MIKGFERPQQTEPAKKDHLQWLPAIVAGLIAGVILLILPHGSPWEGLTLFSPAILGRLIPASWGMPAFPVALIHLGVSVVYGVIISAIVMNFRELRAVCVGGVIGLVLFALNLGIVTLWFPDLRGNEASVIVTHLVFGLIAAGAYCGLLQRKVSATLPPG